MVAHPLAPVRGSDRLVVATSQTCAKKPRRPPPCRSRPRASAAPLSVVRPFALASNESSDTCVLPFASQINHAPSTPAHNRPFEAEVIFCVQGASTAPCGAPHPQSRSACLKRATFGLMHCGKTTLRDHLVGMRGKCCASAPREPAQRRRCRECSARLCRLRRGATFRDRSRVWRAPGNWNSHVAAAEHPTVLPIRILQLCPAAHLHLSPHHAASRKSRLAVTSVWSLIVKSESVCK